MPLAPRDSLGAAPTPPNSPVPPHGGDRWWPGAPEDDSLGTSIDRAAQDPTVGEAPARRISCLSQ